MYHIFDIFESLHYSLSCKFGKIETTPICVNYAKCEDTALLSQHKELSSDWWEHNAPTGSCRLTALLVHNIKTTYPILNCYL